MKVFPRSFRGRHRPPGRWARLGARRRALLVWLLIAVLAVLVVLVWAAAAQAATPAPTSVPKDLTEVINRLWIFLTVIAASFAGLMIAWGAVRHIGADGDDSQIHRARRTMRDAAIGLGLVLLAPLIVATVQKVLG